MIDRIIIADNDKDSYIKAEEILKKTGKKVIILGSGTLLFSHIQEFGLPDMILINTDLPDMDGFEVLELLKKDLTAGTEVPVILVSDGENKNLETKSFAAGAMDFIRKPFDSEVLVCRIQKNLDIQKKILKFEKDAESDLLTGLLNKTAVTFQISDLCQKRSGLLCVIDLDNFKSVNDLYGHDIGDRILIIFSRILKKDLPFEAVIGRSGGDEFMTFIPNVSTENELLQITEKIHEDYLSEIKKLLGEHQPIPLGVSIGAAAVPDSGTDFDKVFQLADQGLYFVKQNGKHGCKVMNSSEKSNDKHRYLDLETVTAILEERDASPNAMWMGNEVFGSIYRYMVRYMERYHAMAYRVLFTVKTPDNISHLANTEIMMQFRKMMQTSLRNSDVMMECGENQLFLLLPEVREYDIDNILNRLLSKWRSSDYSGSVEVTCEAGLVSKKPQAASESYNEKNGWVIVVDDNEINLEMVCNILRKQHLLVTSLHSGSELLDMVRIRKPDLILLDLNMPELDGIDTLARLRKESDPEREVPVIFLTGDDNLETETRCLRLGATDFIKKPFVPEVLILRVTRTIELNRLQRHLAAAVQRKTKENENLSMHIVLSLAEAIDAKDKYTNSHSLHVAKYAKEISRRFGYSEKQQNDIYTMGLLHDIGKIGIPDAVINKPGKLTNEEYELIKRHPVLGAKILQNIEEMPNLAIGAHWHHEHYDGSGYPDGLAGNSIPEEARIIALADAYDAMTSKRSYRGALPQQVVRDEIKNGMGTQFDPKFAQIMLNMIDEDPEYLMREL